MSETGSLSKDRAESSNHEQPFALQPTPSDDPNDPLNWPLTLKIAILIQVSLLAALGTLNTAVINPAYVPLAKEFGISTVQASYQTTVVIAMNGVGPFLWVPLANVYGRRPVYVFSTILGFASALGCAYTRNFGQLLIARVFNGLFPAALSLGAATVVDLFFFHQRGRAMGFFTVMLTSGAHLAPIIGGLVGQFLGWRWCFKFAAVLNGFMLAVIVICLPETLYVREYSSADCNRTPFSSSKQFYGRKMLSMTRHPALKLRLQDFVLPVFQMAKYPSALFPALYYGAQYGFASILPAVTVAHIFSQRFGWDTLQIGLAYGAALTIGGFLGELCAGMVVDRIVKIETTKCHGRAPEPECRLKGIWTGEILVPSGLLVYGFSLQYNSHWMGPVMGMGIAVFGNQVIATVCYTYAIDCYRQESSEVAQLFNFIRQELGMTFAFYAISLGDTIGYQFTFLLFALLGSFLAFVPMVGLMWKGVTIRKRLGRPKHAGKINEGLVKDTTTGALE